MIHQHWGLVGTRLEVPLRVTLAVLVTMMQHFIAGEEDPRLLSGLDLGLAFLILWEGHSGIRIGAGPQEWVFDQPLSQFC